MGDEIALCNITNGNVNTSRNFVTCGDLGVSHVDRLVIMGNAQLFSVPVTSSTVILDLSWVTIAADSLFLICDSNVTLIPFGANEFTAKSEGIRGVDCADSSSITLLAKYWNRFSSESNLRIALFRQWQL
jgi:hypothetical protein